MNKFKYILILFGTIFLLYFTIIFVARLPSYTIKTTGKLYILNKISQSITVFDLFQGKVIKEIPLNLLPREATTLSNQKKIVITNYGTNNIAGNSIEVINTETNEIEKNIYFIERLRPNGIIAFPFTNKVGVVTDVGNYFLIINTETGDIEKKILIEQKGSHFLVIHPYKPIVFVTNTYSGSVSVIDLEQKLVIKIIRCGIATEGIDITPDGSEIWVTNNKENTISVISTKTYQITNTLTTGKESLRLKFSVDGKHCLVTNAGDGTISVYDQHSKKQIKTIRLHGKNTLLEKILYHTPRPVGILIHPNGLYAFIANSNANKIEVLDMKTFTLVSTIGTAKVPDGLTFVK
jgi:YVTN family beta-propeller protein